MAHTLRKHYSQDINLSLDNDSWILTKNASISTDDYGFYGAGQDHNAITVKGDIYAQDGAIYCDGIATRTVVDKGGLLSGYYGVYYAGDHSRATNNGTIYAYYGLYADAGQIRFVNNGLINANFYGVYLADASDTFTNGRKGLIHTDGYAIERTGGAAGQHTITINHGLVSGGQYAFDSSNSDDTLVNDGRLIGTIAMGNGDDTLDTRGGVVKGVIEMAGGDDTLFTDRASHVLTEALGDGTDTVKSTVSYTLSPNVERLFLLGNTDINGKGNARADKLHGNSGDNDLKGMAGADDLWGHKGNDRLFGGADLDADLFYFSTGDGKDKVMDYVDGADQLHLEGWNALTSLTDLKNNHATNQGGNLLIEAGGDSLLVLGINKSDLDAGDVYF